MIQDGSFNCRSCGGASAIGFFIGAAADHQRQPVELEVIGELAALIAGNNQGPTSRGTMVAGVGFEPTTFRL